MYIVHYITFQEVGGMLKGVLELHGKKMAIYIYLPTYCKLYQ